MSGLWDYDDEDDQDNGGAWDVPPPDDDAAEAKAENAKKRKGGRKGGRPAKQDKRRAVSPAAELRPVPMPTTILLDSDDDDDLVLLPSPVQTAGRSGGAAGPSGAAAERNQGGGAAAPAPRPAVSNLNPATQNALAKEQELLRALQEVTERENQPDDDVELDLPPRPSVSRLPSLGLSRLTGYLPMAPLGGGDPLSIVIDDEDDNDDVPAHAGRGVPEPAGAGAGDGAAASALAGAVEPAAAAAPAADRVQLKLVWGSGKDENIKMRVVKTDPFSKMVNKFREIAKERNLCHDPSKIKFLFDGDDLAKMPGETPESMDMEDDMMVDVKLDKKK